jgi:hypothetical protein
MKTHDSDSVISAETESASRNLKPTIFDVLVNQTSYFLFQDDISSSSESSMSDYSEDEAKDMEL